MEKPNYIRFIRELVGDAFIMLLSTSVIIVNEFNEVLLQKRSDNLLWGLPGGLLEIEESIEEGAIREVKEETNLDVELTKFLGVFCNPMMTWRETDKAKVYCFSFVGKVKSGELKINDSESLEFRYFSYDNLPVIHSKDNLDSINAYYQNKETLVEGKAYNDKHETEI